MSSKKNKHSSRPKVHRLPKTIVDQNNSYISRIAIALCIGLLLVGAIPAYFSLQKNAGPAEERAEIVATKTIAEQSKINNQAPVENELLVHNDQGEVIGQLAKIPSDAEKGLQVNTTKNVDNNTGKELLGIIGKY